MPLFSLLSCPMPFLHSCYLPEAAGKEGEILHLIGYQLPDKTKYYRKGPRSRGHPRPASTELAVSLTLGSTHFMQPHTMPRGTHSSWQPRRGNFLGSSRTQSGKREAVTHTLRFAFFGLLQPGPHRDKLFSELAPLRPKDEKVKWPRLTALCPLRYGHSTRMTTELKRVVVTDRWPNVETYRL